MATKTAKARQTETKPVAAPYTPTPKEGQVIQALSHRRAAKSAAPRITVTHTKGGPAQIASDHPDPITGGQLLMAALGTTSQAFAYGLLDQLVGAGSKGAKADADGINFMLAVIAGLEPRDEVEAMLAAQMAAVHRATLTFARRLNHVETIPQQDSAERAFNKLARTFTAQMEALKRYRTGGEQKVTVQHVTVNEGGQAVVGNVSAAPGGGGGEQKGGGQPHAQALAHAPEPALRSQDPQPEPGPRARDAEREVSHARRSLAGRAKG
jgi:hypothetical protein